MRTVVTVAALLATAIGCRRSPSADFDPLPAAVAGVFSVMQGTVIDRATNRGVLGAVVNLVPDDSKVSAAQGASAMTRDDGAFMMERVVTGEYILEVHARGYKVYRNKVRFSPGQTRAGVIYRLSTATVCPAVIAGRAGTGCP